MLQTEKRIRWMKFRYDGSSYEIDPFSARGLDRDMITSKFLSRKSQKPKLNRKWTPPKSHGYN